MGVGKQGGSSRGFGYLNPLLGTRSPSCSVERRDAEEGAWGLVGPPLFSEPWLVVLI